MYYMKKVISVLFILLITACNIYKKIDLAKLSLGMTKQQVSQALNKKPDNLIGAKQYPSGSLEVFQYTRNYDIIPTSRDECYWLYFWNDSLSQWGRPGDWQKEADKIYELRIR